MLVDRKGVKTKTLQLAAEMVGGPRKLRDALKAPSADVMAWLAGDKEPPEEVFLRALDLLLDELDRA